MPPALRNTHFHFAPASGGKRHEHASCRSRTELAPPTAAIPARLSSAEARERLARFGPNGPTAVRRGALALELLTLFLNPLVVILLVASMVSDFLGQPADSTIIFLVVLMGVSITSYKPIAPKRLSDHRYGTRPTHCFLGTSVVSGSAIARVSATGRGTALAPSPNDWRTGLRRPNSKADCGFAMLILRAVFFLVLFTLVVRVALHKGAFESFVLAWPSPSA